MEINQTIEVEASEEDKKPSKIAIKTINILAHI